MFITKSYKNNSYLIFNHPITQKKTKLSISSLEKILLKYYEDKPEVVVRLSSFEKEFMNAANVRPATVWLYRRALNYLVNLFGDIPLNEITINQLEKFKEDFTTIDPTCDCYLCLNHTKSYLRHLFATGEQLGTRLATMHNLRFYLNLMKKIRTAIQYDYFDEMVKNYKDYTEGAPS